MLFSTKTNPHGRRVLLCASLVSGMMALHAVPCTGAQTTGTEKHQAAPDFEIKGTVTDKSGQPIIGAGVFVKGTANGTVTDINGNFAIKVNEPGEIIFSALGYIDRTMAVNGEASLTIEMEEDSQLLTESVAIGYGTVRKADLTGSIAVMSDRDYRNQPVTQVADLFHGRVAGVLVENSNSPGGTVRIRVRGANSINLSNDPLYVVDGIVRESGLEGFNPEDIASIQVLKDASSTAIYGSRGANGVVLITSKRGTPGSSSITVDVSEGISFAAKRYNIVSAYDFAEAYNKYVSPAFSADMLEKFRSGAAGTDWQDEILRAGRTRNYKAAISGGNESLRYYVSGNYARTDGVVMQTNSERYQFRANIGAKVKEWFDINVDINASHNEARTANFGANKINILLDAINFSPVTPVRNEDGSYAKDSYCATMDFNPVASLNEINHTAKTNIFNGHLDLKFDLLPGLTFTSSQGVDYRDVKGYSFISLASGWANNSMTNSADGITTLQSTNNLTYDNSWGRHHLTATAVWEATTSRTTTLGIEGTSLSRENVGWWNIDVAENKTPSNSYSEWTLLSGVGRVIYDYADRYTVTGTIRADGSSKFINRKWGWFPSLAVAWKIGNEEFMQHQDIFTNAKIRASFGIVGNQAIDPYSTKGILVGTTHYFGTSTPYTGYWPGTDGNGVAHIDLPDLTWEKTKQFDLGVDFSVLDSRVNVSADWFYKRTTDGLLKRNIPGYDGGGVIWVNAAEVSNTGLDLSIDARVIESGDFSWNSMLTGTYLKNKVENLAGLDFVEGLSPLGGILTESATRVVKGYPMSSFYLYEWTGLDGEGRDSYADNDGSGSTSSDDRVLMEQAVPKFTLGWNNTLRYKNFEFNAFFTAAFGASRLNLAKYIGASMSGESKFYTFQEAYDQMYGVSSNPRYPALDVTGNDYRANSTKWLEKTDYLRLDNLTVAYNLNRKVCKFGDVRFSLGVQNLFTITGYSGLNPAGGTMMGGNNDINDGFDTGAYPLARTVTAGIRVTF